MARASIIFVPLIRLLVQAVWVGIGSFKFVGRSRRSLFKVESCLR